MIGKYLNQYNTRHLPPGWDRWYALTKSGYTDFQLNENGRLVNYGSEKNYQTDVLSRIANGFVRNSSKGRSPFFMYLAPKAPHAPATPAPRHANRLSGVRLPTATSFNERDVSDKPEWVRERPMLTKADKKELQSLRRDRLRTMLAVDEMIGRLVKTLKASGELRNTYIFFTSDNGYHLGHHRLGAGKWTAYEEDIHLPLIARGPNVPRDRATNQLVLNNDFAPTFAQLGRTRAPGFVDGRSFASLLEGSQPQDWRSALLVEAKASPGRPAYEGVRTGNHLYVEYSTGERELYDMREDPYQLDNRYDTVAPTLIASLESRLEALRDCARAECRDAEDAPPGM